MLKKILAALAVVIAGFVVVVAMQPATFEITRSAHVSAPAEVVFDQLDDFASWDAWSPWKEADPTQKTTLSGAESGVGARTAWEGDEVGKGAMEITAATPPSKLEIRLHFLTPIEVENHVAFDVAPDAEGATVTWTMAGENNFLAKAFGLFVDMDAMVGGDFERGLAKLGEVATAEAQRIAAEQAAAAAAAQAAATPTGGIEVDGAAPVDGTTAPPQ